MGAEPKILVVDDDEELLETVSVLLSASGYHTYTSDSRESGVKQAVEVLPDLVILDVMMETDDAGLLFLEDIRKVDALRHTPVIVLSAVHPLARARFTDMARWQGLSVREFREKPVAMDVLLASVRAALGKQG
jgi:DNA-binding response OmpR family regulator